MAPGNRPVTYRLATPGDALAIAELHAESWRVAYRGMFPDDYLDNEAPAERARVWQERFADPDREATTVTILAKNSGELVGFAHSMLDDDPTYGTLLDNLHVLPDAQRLGIGTRLMAETAAWLDRIDSKSPLYLWVLEDNDKARSFYEALGGEECGRGDSADGGSNPELPPVASVRVCWRTLDPLTRHLPATREPL